MLHFASCRCALLGPPLGIVRLSMHRMHESRPMAAPCHFDDLAVKALVMVTRVETRITILSDLLQRMEKEVVLPPFSLFEPIGPDHMQPLSHEELLSDHTVDMAAAAWEQPKDHVKNYSRSQEMRVTFSVFATTLDNPIVLATAYSGQVQPLLKKESL